MKSVEKETREIMDPLEMYRKYISNEPIALMQIQGNEIFEKEFDNSTVQLYLYCIENGKTWQEVLKFKFDPDVTY